MTRSRLLYALLAAAMIALDRVTKLAVSEQMPLYDSTVIIGGFLISFTPAIPALLSACSPTRNPS